MNKFMKLVLWIKKKMSLLIKSRPLPVDTTSINSALHDALLYLLLKILFLYLIFQT